jgi:hypothetical protein
MYSTTIEVKTGPAPANIAQFDVVFSDVAEFQTFLQALPTVIDLGDTSLVYEAI